MMVSEAMRGFRWDSMCSSVSSLRERPVRVKTFGEAMVEYETLRFNVCEVVCSRVGSFGRSKGGLGVNIEIVSPMKYRCLTLRDLSILSNLVALDWI